MAVLKKSSIALICLLFLTKPATADTEQHLQLLESQIKAGMIYNFLKYTNWPESSLQPAPAPLVVCVLEDNPFDGYLRPLEKRTVNQHTIRVHKVKSVEDVKDCHLLFVSQNERDQWTQLLPNLSEKNILTVSDVHGFADTLGGMIEFSRTDKHMSVEMNLSAVKSAQLQVQERLLNLVTIVQPTIQETTHPVSGDQQ